jgi:hypothetical protein
MVGVCSPVDDDVCAEESDAEEMHRNEEEEAAAALEVEGHVSVLFQFFSFSCPQIQKN